MNVRDKADKWCIEYKVVCVCRLRVVEWLETMDIKLVRP